MSQRPIHEIEQQWQAWWEACGTYRAENGSAKNKFYGLIEFPYPSGEGLHVGHPRSFTAIDVITRKKRMEGMNVLYPIGWDAFGLPTENYAIKTKVKPQEATVKNIANFKRQLKSLGLGFDWSREINTTDPAYYKWTQWQFLQFYKHGLAYKAMSMINWCPRCRIGLANEEAQGGVCERCGTPVEKRKKAQWMIAITKYAERLLSDLDSVDYLDKIKIQQINWIGKSEGAKIRFPLVAHRKVLLATSNHGKVLRIRKLLSDALPQIELKTPQELGLESVEVKEGEDLIENATVKARAYLGKIDIPILGTDSEFFLSGQPLDPAMVKRNALNGQDESSLTAQEIGERMHAYYRELAKSQRGEIEACWKDVFALVLTDGTVEVSEGIRPVTLTGEAHGVLDVYFPLRNLYRVKSTGKYVAEQSEEEKRMELAPYLHALTDALARSATVFTTRPDTLFGATYLVLSPEHEFASRLLPHLSNKQEVAAYIEAAKKKTEIERLAEEKEKTGVELKGVVAINPANGREIPVWIADYVLGGYGTGAIMAVPAHDDRDFAFAKKYDLPIEMVVCPNYPEPTCPMLTEAYTGDGHSVASGFLDGLPTWKAKQDMIAWLTEREFGERAVTYKLRDWVFSRQRYWGEPIPIIFCQYCGTIPVPEDQLPVVLPDVDAYEPTDTGESPLTKIREWVEVPCPKCGGEAERETDTMPNWAGSSWYFLRYCDPQNAEALASEEALRQWMPVDLYNGGMEHTTLHLLYSRFWYKFLWDIGVVPKICGPEPYANRRSHGLILSQGGEKMSKSKGNIVNPDEIVAAYGADVFRAYEMFMGPFDQAVPWNTNGIEGVKRFLDRVWGLFETDILQSDVKSQMSDVRRLYHQSIQKITDDIENMRFNTCVSQLMILTNVYQEVGGIPDEQREGFLKLLAPFVPHLAEELWHHLGHENSIHHASWPSYDANKLVTESFELVVQINGKVRDRLTIARDMEEEAIKALALSSKKVQRWLDGKTLKQVIYVMGKIMNIVAE